MHAVKYVGEPRTNFAQKDRPANRRLKNTVLVLFKNSRFEASRSLKIVEKCAEVLGLYTNKVREVVVARGRWCAQTDCSVLKTYRPCATFSDLLHAGAVVRPCDPPKDGQRRVTGGGVQDSRSMKPRIRNAHLPITHVLDLGVKLLALLHISSTQGRSVDRTSAGSP